MRIGLVADIPDQPVARRVEDVMQRDRELDHAESGAEMSTRDGNGVDGFQPELVGELAELRIVEPAQVGRVMDRVEERRDRAGHEAM